MEDGAEEVVMWQGLLPRMPVRVMLVEGDDSTRQIIEALLRKCSYKVTTLSNGLKAWESLKEKPTSIDLILTEVELPSLSGFNLLNMIMDDEACNSIPVIMMSSHDSMSMIFKCMLRGAADFLVKPIRKNELRNLWQHVWRRHARRQDVMQIEHKMNDNCGVGAVPNEHVPLQRGNKECSEHGSDAQSSCTRSDIETESDRQKILEMKFPNLSKDALEGHDVQTARKQIQLDNSTVAHESNTRDNGTSTKSSHDHVVMGKRCSPRSHEPSKVSNLPVIGGQSQYKDASAERSIFQSETLNTTEVVQENDVQNTLNPIPSLELSLRRYEERSTDKNRTRDCNALNHSYSSAFSLYSNRTVLPTTPRPINIENKSKEQADNLYSSLHNQCSTDASLYTSLMSATSSENTKNMDIEPPSQDGSAVKCTPLRVIPLPLPVSGMRIDNFGSGGSGCATNMPPMLYQPSADAFWPHVASSWQEQAIHANSSRQSDPGHLNPMQGGDKVEQDNRNLQYHATEKNDETKQQVLERLPVSAGTGVNVSNSVRSSGPNCESSVTAANRSMFNVINISSWNDHDNRFLNREGSKQIDTCHLNQREVALNKFRMKKKGRCFQKKVRYQSRKILAEQRPRVKGQFVRKEQVNSQPIPGGCYPSDSTAG